MRGSDFLRVGAETDSLCSFRERCPDLRDQSDGGHGRLTIPTERIIPLPCLYVIADGKSLLDQAPDTLEKSTFQPEPGHGWGRAAHRDAPALGKVLVGRWWKCCSVGACQRMTRSSVLLALTILLQVQTRLMAGVRFRRVMSPPPQDLSHLQDSSSFAPPQLTLPCTHWKQI